MHHKGFASEPTIAFRLEQFSLRMHTDAHSIALKQRIQKDIYNSAGCSQRLKRETKTQSHFEIDASQM